MEDMGNYGYTLFRTIPNFHLYTLRRMNIFDQEMPLKVIFELLLFSKTFISYLYLSIILMKILLWRNLISLQTIV